MANVLPSRPRQATSRRSFAIVASEYHAAFVDGLVEHFRREIDVIAPNSTIALYRVPGAYEIPMRSLLSGSSSKAKPRMGC
jgi:6,7-dimethyl-8-ribityllumazine synthase